MNVLFFYEIINLDMSQHTIETKDNEYASQINKAEKLMIVHMQPINVKIESLH